MLVAGSRSELLEALLRASPEAMVVVGQAGRIEMASSSVEALFGWRPDELVGQGVEVLIPEEVRDLHERHRGGYSRHPIPRALGSGLDLHGRRRDGTVFPVDVSLVPVVIGGTPRVGAFIRDVTESCRGENLLRYVNEISRELLTGRSTPDTLALTARRARILVEAALAWVVVPHGRGALTVVAADGEGAEALVGAKLSPESSFSARAMADGVPLPVGDMTADPAVLPEVRRLGLGPGLYLPMLAEGTSIGALVVARSAGEEAFAPAEVRSLEMFVSAASIVLSLGQAREELHKLQIVSERERIARDLHDTVIQRLFALGMFLQGLERIADGLVAERIGHVVGSIDQVIREIRETIFDLNGPDVSGPDVRKQVREVAAEAAAQLGFEPRVAFRGPVEAALPDEVVPHLVAVVREALSNAARHAKATTVEVVLAAAADGSVGLSVADDGVGIPEGPSAGHGLANMQSRAAKLGGVLRVARRHPSGTLVEWRVPSRPG